MLGIDDLQFQTLKFFPISSQRKTPVQIRFRCDDGDNFTLDYVLLEVTKPGTKAITFANQEIGTPVYIEFVLNQELKSVDLRVQPRDAPLSATQYFDLLRLITCLSKNAQIEVVSLEYGFPLFELSKSKSDISPPDPRFVALIKDLRTIQLKTKKPLIIPDREFTRDEFQLITKTHQIVTIGRIETIWSTCSIGIIPTPNTIDSLKTTFGNDKEGQLLLETEETIELFNVVIPLGRVRHHLHTAKLKNIESIIANCKVLNSVNSEVKLMFAPGTNTTVIREYLDWLP